MGWLNRIRAITPYCLEVTTLPSWKRMPSLLFVHSQPGMQRGNAGSWSEVLLALRRDRASARGSVGHLFDQQRQAFICSTCGEQ